MAKLDILKIIERISVSKSSDCETILNTEIWKDFGFIQRNENPFSLLENYCIEKSIDIEYNHHQFLGPLEEKKDSLNFNNADDYMSFIKCAASEVKPVDSRIDYLEGTLPLYFSPKMLFDILMNRSDIRINDYSIFTEKELEESNIFTDRVRKWFETITNNN